MGRVPFEAIKDIKKYASGGAQAAAAVAADLRTCGASEEAIAFIGGLLAEEEVRLGCGPTGFLPIREHPWFKSVDWTGLLRRDVAPPYEPGVVVRDVGGQVGPFIASLDADGDAAEKVSEAELVRRIALGPPDSPGKSTRSPAGTSGVTATDETDI